MSAFRNYLLRRLSGPPRVLHKPHQRRWARVHDIRYLTTHPVQERITDRYREKLDRKAKEQGLKDIQDLKDAYKQKIESLRKQALVPGATGPITTEIKTTAFPPGPPPPPQPQLTDNNDNIGAITTTATTKSPLSGPQPLKPGTPPPPPGIKTLSSYLDLDKTLQLPPTEIEYLWRLRHATKENNLHFTIPSTSYAHLIHTAHKHPQFILPLPHPSNGAEIHFLQWTFPHPQTVNILFTHLAEYKIRGEYASPHTTVSLHEELLEGKGLVLGHGVVMEGRGVDVDGAKWLVMCLQKFYGLTSSERGRERRRLLELFSSGDEGFKVEELLDEAERIG
ncbi:ATP11-domain-containing protein [Tothia fuscella]|uniref:ATP11-domain-containing protein n=1 Tax=Tothia fuscella TaxID=1048955 RepID=A0A9P4NRB0_9PEZI|nr:ATP11-domain-containing protein [Tothia fuscella]